MGWQNLLDSCPFRGKEQYSIAAYSEFMPPIHLGCRPYDGMADGFFSDKDLYRFPVTEYEEYYELRPGLESIAHQVLETLIPLVRGEAARHLAKNKLVNNPYWPPELAKLAKTLKHERFVLIMPLALSLTQDDKGRRRWTFFGGSEQGPAHPFWKSFFTSYGSEIPSERAMGFIRTLLNEAYGEPFEKLSDLYQTGFRIFAEDVDQNKTLRPAWTSHFFWRRDEPLRGVKYLLNFEPFESLPADVKKAYFAGELNLLPFPGSLLFWGVPGFLKMQGELAFANQIPLLHLIERHESPYGLRVPQSGWMHIQHPDHSSPHEDFGPIRNTFQRTHRWARIHRYEDELATPGRQDNIAKVLFSTAPDDLELYGKPMARNSQIWTQDHRLILDGPNANKAEISSAIRSINQGGLFGYRFHYPPMHVGSYQIYWHRPLIAYLSHNTEKPAVFADTLLGYLTAYDVKHPALNHPIELWPHLYERSTQTAAIELFKDKKHEQKTVTRILNLLEAQDRLGIEKLPRSFAGQILMLPEKKTLDTWLESLPEIAGDTEQGQDVAHKLQDIIGHKELAQPVSKRNRLPVSMTFGRTAVRSFEARYWTNIVSLSTGKFINKANSDCILDPATQRILKHHHRDLDALGDYLLAYYRQIIAACGMQGTALVGDLPFRWKTDFNFDWWGGWVNDQEGRLEERNLMVVIPGHDRGRAVLMADHYDTAYMEDIYYREKGGSGARIAAAGADDNHSATAALMGAVPVFCDLSRKGNLGCDIWIIHLTGEEFPSDCLGSRHLCQQLVEGTLKLRLSGDQEKDLSDVKIQGAFILDMIAHNNESELDKFQIAPGMGAKSLWLAYQAHIANEMWNASTYIWNRRSSRRGLGRGKRSRDKKTIPDIASHPKLDGQIRLPRDPKSTLYNTDAQIFSDAGIPVVLFMENYDITRHGYHDSQDTMVNIDLDYGAAVAAIAVEAAARAASDEVDN
ncbi:MAG TPA: M28 family peptidase [Syntrophales bacterium]|nr:M28 family peptidase [Syntrophales bacterium]